MKPGTGSEKQETREQFAERMAKDLRTEARRILSDAQRQAKEIRKVASTFDGRRS